LLKGFHEIRNVKMEMGVGRGQERGNVVVDFGVVTEFKYFVGRGGQFQEIRGN
jgi:hypothetical protein